MVYRTGILLCLLMLLVGAAVAQDGALEVVPGDPYLDPLAFQRIDETATDLPLTVRLQTTGETRQVEGRHLLAGSQEMYLPSSTAASILKASRFWDGAQGQLTLKVGLRDFVFMSDNRLVVSPEGESLLPVPVLEHEGDLWLPMVLITEIMGPQIEEHVVWDAAERKLRLGSVRYNVTGLKTERLGRSTAVHIQCDTPLGYRATSPQPGVIELKIYGAVVNPFRVGQSSQTGLLLHARSRQYEDHAIVTLKVDQLVGRYRTYVENDGAEIVLVLEEELVAAIPSPVPHGQSHMNLDAGVMDATNSIRVRTVVIDPGHGGHDAGAVGGSGILEKNVNLAVARELKRYLDRESDLQVVLTRDRDEFVPLAGRAEIANRAGGDLFISLHCNSWFSGGARGFETYFLSPAKSDWAKSVEAAENSSDGEPGDVEFIVWDLVQNQFISASSQLAEVMQKGVIGEMGLVDRGVRQAGFRVLVGAYMPAVLVELGFLSHKTEEKQLGEAGYQRRMARALGQTILEYSRIMEATTGAPQGGE